MAEASLALGSLGSDLTFAVSFSIAAELLAAATEAEVAEDELVSAVLVISVMLAALPRTIGIVMRELSRFECCSMLGKMFDTGSVDNAGLAAYLSLVVNVGQRVAVSVAVQLLAANARAKQPLRSVRIISLLSVCIFFIFLSGTSSVGTHKTATPAT
jgi:hypothetical protein